MYLLQCFAEIIYTDSSRNNDDGNIVRYNTVSEST